MQTLRSWCCSFRNAIWWWRDCLPTTMG